MNVTTPSSTSGEFRGDFTRDSFDPVRQFSRVLMQQGRVQLDADWNEQTAILLHYLRTLAVDLIGAAGGPEESAFELGLSADGRELVLSPGRYYVDGILCENGAAFTADDWNPPPFVEPVKTGEPGDFLVFLDVWERHVCHEADEAIADVALGGLDTASRAQVTWQLRALPVTGTLQADLKSALDKPRKEQRDACLPLAKKVQAALVKGPYGTLKARARSDAPQEDLCTLSPESKFRGLENQLYRVEIHTSGVADRKGGKDRVATFKWSRDNGSVVFPVLAFAGSRARLSHLGRDSSRGLKPGDCVEVVYASDARRGRSGPLLAVEQVLPDETAVVLSGPTPAGHPDGEVPRLLRRWDQAGGAALEVIASGESWIGLEDGLQIQFTEVRNGQYHAGDYWLIPARIETGDILWKTGEAAKDGLLPHGVAHHYAPLAAVRVDNDRTFKDPVDLRTRFKPAG